MTNISSTGVALTEAFILQETELNSLDAVRNLYLWNRNIDDVSVLRDCPSLEFLTLSANKISTLECLAECKNLKELYIRKNNIKSRAEIKHLAQLPNLRMLWLSENPCTAHPQYRELTIHMCSGLTHLDDCEVTTAEKDQASKLTQQEIAAICNDSHSTLLQQRRASKAAAANSSAAVSDNNRYSTSAPFQQVQLQFSSPAAGSTSAINTATTSLKNAVDGVFGAMRTLSAELEKFRNSIDQLEKASK
jgi:hypothetical protein